jgi:heme exporter protein CcmD
MSEFLAMGGYAEFVWGSYGFALATLVFNMVSARRRLRSTLDRLAVRAVQRRRVRKSS